MIYDKLIPSTQALRLGISSFVTPGLNTPAVFAWFGPLLTSGNTLTGRTCFHIETPFNSEIVTYEPRVTEANFTSAANSTNYSVVKCDYLSGDFFYYTANYVSGKVCIQVPHMNNAKQKGKSIMLQLNLGNATSTYFGAATNKVFEINTGGDYTSGTYYFVFANIAGNTVELINFFKGTSQTINTWEPASVN